MDLFNQPKEFDYKNMNHKLKLEEIENPYIQVVWEEEFVLTLKKSMVQRM